MDTDNPNTRTLLFCQRSSNFAVDKSMSTPDLTTITYTSPLIPGKVCIYQLPGQWEIVKASANGTKLTIKKVLDLKPFVLPLNNETL